MDGIFYFLWVRQGMLRLGNGLDWHFFLILYDDMICISLDVQTDVSENPGFTNPIEA